MDFQGKLCKQERYVNKTTEFEDCDYTQDREEYAINVRNQVAGLNAIYGTVKNMEPVYLDDQYDCIDRYIINVQSDLYGEVNFIVTSNTYLVDCFYDIIGTKVIGFFDPSLPMLLIYPPQYQIRVLALDLPGRSVKADFFDCFLVSLDDQLQLEISNNTYITSEENGKPYCDNISNKYMVALYSVATRSIPAITKPNVLIVLR